MSTKTTVGLDPELFIVSRSTGKVLPSCGIIGGTKDRPLPLGGGGFFVQEDNVSVEFNVPPTSSVREAKSVLQDALGRLRLYVQGLYGDDAALAHTASVTLDDADICSLPSAYHFGCAPELCAYTSPHDLSSGPPGLSFQDLIDPSTNKHSRFGGGHIHIGFEPAVPDIPSTIVARLCDAVIGLRLAQFDKQGARRTFNGKAGRFRKTSYGIEYRTPSNAWTDMRMGAAAWDVAFSAALGLGDYLSSAQKQDIVAALKDIPTEDMRHAIEQEDEEACANLRNYLASQPSTRPLMEYTEAASSEPVPA